MKMSIQLKTLCLAAIFVCFVSFVGYSQTATATLSGTITDEHGAIVPGVAVTITDTAKGLKRNAVTNDEGQYTVPLLPPGEYTVTFAREGFTQVQVAKVILNVADQKALNIALKVGDVKAAIDVRADENLVNVGPSVATTIDRTFVGNMPLNGRNFSDLVLLTPGVTVANTGDGGRFSVNGQRAASNYVTIDGVGANTGFSQTTPPNVSGNLVGYNAVGGTSNLVSVDALEEFKVQTSTYTAELGRQPGGQIQVVTRSGKNQYHGSLFEYVRNETLDARDFFNKVPAKQNPLRQNDFGGTFSGPLPFLNFGEGKPFFSSGKDKTFFFFSYEGQRIVRPVTVITKVPSLRLRQQAAPSVRPLLLAYPTPTQPETLTTTNCPAVNPPDPACDPVSNKLFSGFSPYTYGYGVPSSSDATSVRIDHRINQNHSVFGRFNYAPSYKGDSAVPFASYSPSATRAFTVGLTSILGGTKTNDLRFNYTREANASKRTANPIDGAVAFDQGLVAFNGGQANVFIIGPSGLSMVAGTFQDSFQKQLNLVDTLSIGWGSHQIKAGVDFRRLSPTFLTGNQTLLNFMTESALRNASVTTVTLTAIQAAKPRYDNISTFIQDSWRASTRMTVDVGIRWEINPTPTEADGNMPYVVQGINGTDVSHAQLAPPGTPFFKTFYGAFAPRLGAAYRLFQKPGRETVVRGGFGVYYDLGETTTGNGWPFRTAVNLAGSCLAFPIAPQCTTLPTPTPSTTTTFAFQQNIKLPYTLHWNTTVEQSLGHNQVLSASYVGAAGRRLLTTKSLNQAPIDPNTGLALPRPNPSFGEMRYTYNGPTSDYHALQVQYSTRLSNGIQALVSYTWSHSIDETSLDAFDQVLEKGNSSFDVRHNLAGALHYVFPRVQTNSILSALLNGWSTDAIIHVQSGLPVNINAGALANLVVDSYSVTIRPDYIAGQPLYLDDANTPGHRRFNPAAFKSPAVCLPLGAPNCANKFVRQGTFGRNILRGAPIEQVDFSLSRTLSLGEKVKMQLRGDAFNVFNHPMFTAYNPNIQQADFGTPSATLSSGLGGNAIQQLGGARSIQLSARLSF